SEAVKRMKRAAVREFEVLFFYSGRGRYTRWPRDWSSVVCSSDLSGRRRGRPCRSTWAASTTPGSSRRPARAEPVRPPLRRHDRRSEERRVGKECRSWLLWFY